MTALPIDPDAAAERVAPAPPLPLRPILGRGHASDDADAPPGMPGGTRREVAPPADPDRWFGALALAVVEVLAGARPAQQLVRWLTPEIYGAIARRAGLRVRLHGRPVRPVHGRVLSVRATATENGGVEVCAVVHDGRRVRAVAGRLELFRARWRVVELQVG